MRAASLREDQLLQRQADAFARGSLREAATPTPKPSAKKPASAKPARKPAQPAVEPAQFEFLEVDLKSRLVKLGLGDMGGALAAAAVLNMGDVIAYTSGKQLRDELERSGEYKVPLHQCNSLLAKKPARAPPLAADEDDDLLAGIFSAMEAAPPRQ